MLKRVLLALVVTLVASSSPAWAQAGFANMVDHLHLAAPDQAVAAAWYRTHLGGQATPEGPDRLMFGTSRMIFQKTAAPGPSKGSVFELIGFSVPNLDATIKQLTSAGVKIETPIKSEQGMKVAQIVDPWGTLIDLVEDPQKIGLHHVSIVTPRPAEALAWYTDAFGGRIEKYKGVDGINYGGVWIFAKEGESVPSAGRSIDHIGFRPVNVDAAVAALKVKNVKVTTEPRPLTLPSGTSMRLAFVEGPSGARIEIVQRENLPPATPTK